MPRGFQVLEKWSNDEMVNSAVVLACVPLLAAAGRTQQVRAEFLDGKEMAASTGQQTPRGFEVWIADQSHTRPGCGGQLLIYEGSDLMGNAAARRGHTLDLGAGTP